MSLVTTRRPSRESWSTPATSSRAESSRSPRLSTKREQRLKISRPRACESSSWAVWAARSSGVALTHPEHLFKYFSQFGQVLNAYVIFDPDSKQSRGFGYVEFSSVEEANDVLQASDHEISGRRLTVENHRNGLTNTQLLQSQVSRELVAENRKWLREAKAQRSPVSKAGIASSAPTTQSGAGRAFLTGKNSEHIGFQSSTGAKQAPALALRLEIPVARSKTNICAQKSIFGRIPKHPPVQPDAALSSLKPSSKKQSAAMRDLVKRHLSGSCSSEQFLAHSLNEQNLRFSLGPSSPKARPRDPVQDARSQTLANRQLT